LSEDARLTRFAWLSIAAALVTIALKFGAFVLTGSVGLLSDALESLVNLAAAVMALAMLTIAARPPDEEHAYGHSKAEYFASSFEGALILLAAASIAYSSVVRLLDPQPVRDPLLGIAISAVASVVNLCRDLSLGGPNALAATKQLLRRPHSMAELQALSESLFTSDEGREGMAAFGEKRPPRWVV